MYMVDLGGLASLLSLVAVTVTTDECQMRSTDIHYFVVESLR